jgi:oxidase EvaA
MELGPTVQCLPSDYAGRPAAERPRYLDRFLDAGKPEILFDSMLSEEGGRFHDAQTRYLILADDGRDPIDEPDDYRWIAVHQLAELLRHGQYLSVQARTLLTCLHSASGDHRDQR